ncbi:TPA: DMT family transporter [Serratia fonticola]|jgi:drug/metabolite transporter (DMT)-like permease|uniref:Predicted permease, DMT superfamily n=1 Tax=Serratia fonticola TaxID=47917 RepID=A0A0F7D3D4_SERFO|nr:MULTISPECIES: DMT family transporter [Serratia]AKG72290.1 membrane protein [Serratia fonticola]AYM91256.1 EamA family transporter [Serratia sp. 3ACOL1]CAI1512496.1 Predicted permease, DMT superfamily [Serratia fonticola]CAI1538014.1 Predicted permease, DMT superfamily [Serratia fonticola]CAI1700232.1 Predicted permease, DMT superfamily [Serratia fonticola]
MSLPSGVVAEPVVVSGGILRGTNQGYVIAIISAMLLAFTAIIIRALTEYYHLPTFVLAFWRAALVALVLLPLLLLFKPQWAYLRREQVPFYAGYGLLLALFNSLWTLSVALNGASVATILTYCSVGFTVFLGWMMYNERLSLRELLVIVVSLGGCFLVSNGDSMGNSRFDLLGLMVGMLSGIGYTLYTLGGRIASERRYPVWNTILYVFGFSAVYQWLFNTLLTLFPLAAFHGMAGDLWFLSQGAQGIQWSGWLLLLTLAAGPTLLGFGLYNISLKTLPLAVANLILSLELVFTAVIAYFLLGENMNQLQLLGSALVMGGVLMLRKAK